MEGYVPLLVVVLLVISAIVRVIWAKRIMERTVRKRRVSTTLPLWFTDFLKQDFLNPAFRRCHLRLYPAGDQSWRMNAAFEFGKRRMTRQLIDPVSSREIALVEKNLDKIGWVRSGRQREEDGFSIACTRRSDSLTQSPPEPDPSFNTSSVTDSRLWEALATCHIDTSPSGENQWQVSVGFYASVGYHTPQESSKVDFGQALTIGQIMKIIADLRTRGWQETRRAYYQTHPGTTQYYGKITYTLERDETE
ncbi:MAG: hypothetical protein M5R40_07940 [Anaerolineae bacterium]|nr:hypothetical protein [Anaerolineae bacterium]